MFYDFFWGTAQLLFHLFIYSILLSQVGVLPMDESKVTMKGRLGPGMMIAADLQTGQVCFEFFAGFNFCIKSIVTPPPKFFYLFFFQLHFQAFTSLSLYLFLHVNYYHYYLTKSDQYFLRRTDFKMY